jgi:putative ABC transport system substrate-binding protein
MEKPMKSSRILLVVLALMLVASGSAYAQGTEDYVVANFLWYSGQGFKDQMAELGYIEGQNLTYLETSFEGYDTMTAEEWQAEQQRRIQAILDAHPDVIVTNTDLDALSMNELVGDIPIVFARSDDPVASGAVADLVAPGGMLTGSVTNRPHERRLQVLTEINPATDRVYFMYNPLMPDGESLLNQVLSVGQQLGLDVIPVPIVDTQTGMDALANMPEGVDWLFLTPYVMYDFTFLAQLNTVSMEQKIPIAGIMDTPTQGYLMGYGPSIYDSDAEAARIVDRIFRGANPAELPVQTIENVLTINLEAAEDLGIEIPAGILRQAELIVRRGYFDELNSGGVSAGLWLVRPNLGVRDGDVMFNSLRVRLTLLFLGLTIVPLVIVGSLVASRGTETLQQQSVDLQHQLARQTAISLGAFFKERQNELLVLTQVYGFDALAPEDQKDILLTMLSHQPAYYQFSLVDADGQQLIRVTRGKIVTTNDLTTFADDPQSQRTLGSNTITFSNVSFDAEARDRIITIEVPIEDLYTGEIGHVLIANVRFQNIEEEILRGLNLSEARMSTSGQQRCRDCSPQSELVLNETVFGLPATKGRHTGLTGGDVIWRRIR